MRLWQFWCRTLVLTTQYNPPEFVELVMTLLTMALLIGWEVTDKLPYLVLSASLAMGAAVSMWVRGYLVPSHHPRLIQLLALLLLSYSVYTFAVLVVPAMNHL